MLWWDVRDRSCLASALGGQAPQSAASSPHFGVISFTKGPGFSHFCPGKVSSQREAGWLGAGSLTSVIRYHWTPHQDPCVSEEPALRNRGRRRAPTVGTFSVYQHETAVIFTWDTRKRPEARPSNPRNQLSELRAT